MALLNARVKSAPGLNTITTSPDRYSHDEDHLLFQLAVLVQFRADPEGTEVSERFQDRKGTSEREDDSLPVEGEHLLELLVLVREDVLDDGHEEVGLERTSKGHA